MACLEVISRFLSLALSSHRSTPGILIVHPRPTLSRPPSHALVSGKLLGGDHHFSGDGNLDASSLRSLSALPLPGDAFDGLIDLSERVRYQLCRSEEARLLKGRHFKRGRHATRHQQQLVSPSKS